MTHDRPPQVDSSPPTSAGYGEVLTFGYGSAVAMWTVGYFCRLPGVGVPNFVLFAALIAALLLGGFLAGRASPRGAVAGAAAGLVAGLINLLVLGSLLRSPDDGSVVPSALLWLPGSIAATTIVCTIGAALGALTRSATPTDKLTPDTPRDWTFPFACVTAAATLVLLSVGGTVTGYEAGLAVPDWPNSYGYNMFLFPLARMTGGIYYEHAHRLFGSLVGLCTLTLALYVGFVERRNAVRALAGAALVMVIVQGVLGGLRVTGKLTLAQSPEVLSPSTALAVVHGVFGQCFFATLVCLAATLSRTWRSEQTRVVPAPAGIDLELGVASILALMLQLALGALLRHTNWGMLVHVTFAIAVIVLVSVFAVRAWAQPEERPVLPKLGGLVLGVLMLQLMLGLFSMVLVLVEREVQPSAFQVLVTTAHQTTGALLLASTASLALWRLRVFSYLSSADAAAAGEPVRQTA